jgi:hypothetical protein
MYIAIVSANWVSCSMSIWTIDVRLDIQPHRYWVDHLFTIGWFLRIIEFQFSVYVLKLCLFSIRNPGYHSEVNLNVSCLRPLIVLAA